MSERTEHLRKESLAAVPSITGERAAIVTAFYREHYGKHSMPVLRGLNFLEIVEHKALWLGEGELIVGERGPRPKAVPTFPELTCHSVEDLRILDSRLGIGGPTSPWSTGRTRELTVTGHNGIPAGATAVVVNLTATDTTDQGYVTAWPDGRPRPLASNLNFGPGQTIANLVTVPVGADGAIDLYNFAGSTDLVADVVGYYTAS